MLFQEYSRVIQSCIHIYLSALSILFPYGLLQGVECSSLGFIYRRSYGLCSRSLFTLYAVGPVGFVSPRLLIKVGQAQWSWRELIQIHVTTSLENLFSILNTEGNTPCNPPLHSLYKPSPKRWGGGAGGPGLWGTSCPSSLFGPRLDALQTLHVPSPQPGLAPQFGSLTMGWESSPGSPCLFSPVKQVGQSPCNHLPICRDALLSSSPLYRWTLNCMGPLKGGFYSIYSKFFGDSQQSEKTQTTQPRNIETRVRYVMNAWNTCRY